VESGEKDGLLIAVDLSCYSFFKPEKPRSCNEDVLFKLITAEVFFGSDKNCVTNYGWLQLAKGFLSRFPGRAMQLFRIILSRIGDLPTIREMSYPTQVADLIVRDHPDESWAIISKALESKAERAGALDYWLGDDRGFGEDQHNGIIRLFDPQAVIQWASQDPDLRTQLILSYLPKTLDDEQGGRLTREFIETFGGTKDIDDGLISQFWTGGYTGLESQNLARKRDRARAWISNAKSEKVLDWLYRYIQYLNRRIEHAEMREEREF